MPIVASEEKNKFATGSPMTGMNPLIIDALRNCAGKHCVFIKNLFLGLQADIQHLRETVEDIKAQMNGKHKTFVLFFFLNYVI